MAGRKLFKIALIATVFILIPKAIFALEIDTDKDGLNDEEEINIYRTDPNSSDTDKDGYLDGEEVKYNFDPNKAVNDRLEKRIEISLKEQSLTYFLGPYSINTFKISSGLPRTQTPKGEFKILQKKPLVTYKGANYYYPNTRWNMLFAKTKFGNLYIHGAYWHNKFGKPASHGCVNVSYNDIENLYNWTDEGVRVIIE